MAKGKKAKSPSKSKKSKNGGKAKPAKKASSPGKPPSARLSKTKSSAQLQTTGSSQEITARSTAALTAGQSGTTMPAPGLFKPVSRPMLPPLVLPADRNPTLIRRPSIIIIWKWENMWFFPASVFAIGLVVLGMIILTMHMPGSELAAQAENYTSVGNATLSGSTLPSGSDASRTHGQADAAHLAASASVTVRTSELIFTTKVTDEESVTQDETTLGNLKNSTADSLLGTETSLEDTAPEADTLEGSASTGPDVKEPDLETSTAAE